MASFAVEVYTEADGSLIIRPHGPLDTECAVQFRQVLVHAVRRIRPLRLHVDLVDVSTVDAINLGTLAALCDLADDHQVVLFLDNAAPGLTSRLHTAGIPPQRLRQPTP